MDGDGRGLRADEAGRPDRHDQGMTTRRRDWPIPTALVLLSVVPMLGGALRVADLASGAAVTPDNERFIAMPVPVLLHIFGATIFCVLGAFQFAPGLRRGHPRWHRRAGRLLVLCGLTAAGSGLWMTAFYPHPPIDGPLLIGFRFTFGTAMFVAVALGLRAILRRDVRHHRAWMMRGYAIAQGAGTQAVLFGLWAATGNATTELSRALIHAAAWVLNLCIAEWLIGRRPAPRPATRIAPVAVGQAS
jgi:uncharacterized membrane protein